MAPYEPLNIVVASDQNYVPHLETLLVSIGENNGDAGHIRVYVLDGGIEQSSKDFIQGMTQRYPNMVFSFIPMREEDIAARLGGNIAKDRSLLTYARVFIPSFVEGHKALYLDVDGIVVRRLVDLFSINFENDAVAGVLDASQVVRHQAVGINNEHVYVNAGVLLWNLERCREMHFTEECIKFIESHDGDVPAMDQGTINGILGTQNLIRVIEPKYNAYTTLFQLSSKQVMEVYGIREFYSDSEIDEARRTPTFVHFTSAGTTRPWERHCRHPLREQYWQYRALTEFPDKCLMPDGRSRKARMLGWTYRNANALYILMLNVEHVIKWLKRKE